MSDQKKTMMERIGLDRVIRRATGFRRDEGGAMIVFGLTMFVMMLWVGGMAIDFMRFEHDRARVQYTLDRAALAAASLNQPLDCKDVAENYFEKAGLDTTTITVNGQCSELSKTVRIDAKTEVHSLFLNLLGIESMVAGGTSIAVENVQDVEISLVLDISGSMGWNDATGSQSKLDSLKVAAKDFLRTLLIADNADRVSINIIPYNMQVNAGEDILDALTVTNEHNYSHCVDFEHNDFGTVEINDEVATGMSLGTISLDAGPMGSSATPLQRTGHFDPYYTTIDHPHSTSDDNSNRAFVCSTEEYSRITLMSQNLSELEDRIDDLEPQGNTSIDIGVKWGSYFLNPNAEDVIDALPNNSPTFTPGGRPDAFQDRPYAYDRENTIKILVVMTDGVNTTQYMLDEDYASGDSTLWWNPDPDDASLWLSHYKQRSGPSNDYFMSYGNYYEDYFNGARHDHGEDERLTWPEVWNMMGVKYMAYYYHYARDWDSNQYYNFRGDVLNYVYRSTKNTRLNNACTAAKDEDVVVFTIGFEVSDDSATVMQNCASSESHFFRVEGTEISDAFGAIAKTIQRLKLTQ